MKSKIENLIKEVGINEVETILKQIKSKLNVKENLKKDFIDLISGCNISFDDKYGEINYLKNGELLFYYQKSKNHFYFRFDIWSKFQSNYQLNYQELSNLLIGIVEEVLNYNSVTPLSSPWPYLL